MTLTGCLRIWNSFLTKLGWRDHGTEYLQELKAEAGMADRDDILTFPELIEADEGRKPAPTAPALGATSRA